MVYEITSKYTATSDPSVSQFSWLGLKRKGKGRDEMMEQSNMTGGEGRRKLRYGYRCRRRRRLRKVVKIIRA